MSMRFPPRTAHTYIEDFWGRLKNNYGGTPAASDYRRPGSRILVSLASTQKQSYIYVLAIWGKRGHRFA